MLTKDEMAAISKMVAQQLEDWERDFNVRQQKTMPRGSAPPSPASAAAQAEQIQGVADKILGGVRGYVERSLRPWVNRVQELETRATMKYVGTWYQGLEVKTGEFVTHDGSLWHCRQTTLYPPNHHPEQYQLAVKSTYRR
jgi:hypothetical protein